MAASVTGNYIHRLNFRVIYIIVKCTIFLHILAMGDVNKLQIALAATAPWFVSVVIYDNEKFIGLN